jgi:hypothetical protein
MDCPPGSLSPSVQGGWLSPYAALPLTSAGQNSGLWEDGEKVGVGQGLSFSCLGLLLGAVQSPGVSVRPRFPAHPPPKNWAYEARWCGQILTATGPSGAGETQIFCYSLS